VEERGFIPASTPKNSQASATVAQVYTLATGEPSMKKALVILTLCLAAAFALAQDDGFQPAKVVAFERVANDAQHPEKSDDYKISMRLDGVIYNCHSNAPVTVFNDWTVNKEFPAKVNGKTLLVKNFDGQIIEMNIVGKKKPK
jgi:hypothetical protein